MSESIPVHVEGRDIYEVLNLPVVPRKGDILNLSSLTRGRVPVLEAQVSKVQWAMDQATGSVHVWLTVRRTKERPVSPTPSEERR